MSIRNQYVRNLLPLLQLKISYENYQQCTVDYMKMNDEKMFVKEKMTHLKSLTLTKLINAHFSLVKINLTRGP